MNFSILNYSYLKMQDKIMQVPQENLQKLYFIKKIGQNDQVG